MLKKGWLIVLGAVMLLAAAACAPLQTTQPSSPGQSSKSALDSPQRGGTLAVGVSGEAGELDPHKTSVGLTRRFSRLLYNTLTNSDASGKVVPELAESWSTSAPNTYVFKLRKGVKFHDGTDFNAEAVKFNYDRILNPETKSLTRAQLLGAGLKSIDVIDDYTVQFKLEAPNAGFPSYLADFLSGGGIVSPTAVKKWGNDLVTHPVGTGPFEFVEWVKDDHLTVKRFDGYWRKDEKGNPLPYLDQVIFKPIPDTTVRLTGLRTGNLDMVDFVDPSDVATVKADQGLKSVDWGVSRMAMYLNCAQPPFNNKALRQAVAWAVDPEPLHKAIYGGIGGVAQAPLAPADWAFDPQGKFYARDLAKAKGKLAEAGKPDGFKFAVKGYTSPLEMRLAQAVKAQLAEVGIDMDIVAVEERQLSAERVAANYQAIFTKGGGLPPDPDSELYPMYDTKGQRNYGKCGNAELDQTLEQAQQVVDQGQRKALYAKAQALILDDSPWVFLHHDALTTAMNKKVQGFVPNVDLFYLQFDWIWLQK